MFSNYYNTSTSTNFNHEPLTLEELQEAINKIPKVPTFDTVVAHSAINIQEDANLFDMKIIKSEFLTEAIQTFKPRTKCKRIQKKAKKLYTKTVPSNKIYLIDTKVLQEKMYKHVFDINLNITHSSD